MAVVHGDQGKKQTKKRALTILSDARSQHMVADSDRQRNASQSQMIQGEGSNHSTQWSPLKYMKPNMG